MILIVNIVSQFVNISERNQAERINPFGISYETIPCQMGLIKRYAYPA